MKTMRVLMITLMALMIVSCETVQTGHVGVKVNWGGDTEMSKIYPEGLHTGFDWMFDDMVQYEAREITINYSSVFLDVDNMKAPVDVILQYRIQADAANKLHKDIGVDYLNSKIIPALEVSLKNVIPQYKVLELNTIKREEADIKLYNSLVKKLPEFYTNLVSVNVTKVEIPQSIADQVVKKQVQDERNLLAKKIEEEKFALGRAQVVEDSLKSVAASYEAKTKDILSSPKMLDLYEAETRRKWAEKGVSPFGTNNVFGATGILKGYQN